MEFLQIDVFADGPFTGNPLAVFPDAGALSRSQMQSIASEMNLSETSFVTRAEDDSYDVRIFTPTEEMPFAGHPTIGTAWILKSLGHVASDEIAQRSPVGVTRVRFDKDTTWFERPGRAQRDLEDEDWIVAARLDTALGLSNDDIGLEAREIGRHGRLRPAFSNAAFDQLMVPVKDLDSLASCSPRADLLRDIAGVGAYCFTAVQAGRLRARGFFPTVGVTEDPATGSAAAALGIYLADRVGEINLEVVQGVEIGRPSRILLRAARGRVEVGGRCHRVLSGRLESLPPRAAQT